MGDLRHLFAVAVVTALVIATPVRAQNTNAAAADRKAPALETAEKKKPVAGPFRGKLAAVDKANRTITVGKRTFLITPDTRILRDGKPAALADGVVGELVSGYVKPNEAGKLVATKVNLTPNPSAKPGQPKAP